MTKTSSQGVASVEKALDILEYLATTHAGQTATQIAAQLDLPKSTTHNLLTTLEGRSYLARNAENLYSLGNKLLDYGFTHIRGLQVRQVALTFLENLCALVNETCHMAVWVDGHAVYVEKVESPASVKLGSQIGATATLHASAVGKVLLAGRSESELVHLVAALQLPALTPTTITDRAQLLAELTAIRRRQYAEDNEEEHVGVRCVGAPVYDHRGRMVAAISVAGLAQRLTNEFMGEIIGHVQETARAISRQMGHQPETDAGLRQ